MKWWIWVLIGFLLLALELTTTTLHLAFFGIGALVVGLLVSLHMGGPLWLQVLLFTAISVTLLLFRRHLLQLIKNPEESKEIDNMVGETAVAMEDIVVGGLGRAELRGASWTARNAGDRDLIKSERCTVVRIEGLVLCLTAVGTRDTITPGFIE